MALDEVASLFFDVLQVEHVVQVAVRVTDQVKHHMAVILIGIDVVKNHQGIGMKTCGDFLSCFSIDDMKKSLQKKTGNSTTENLKYLLLPEMY